MDKLDSLRQFLELLLNYANHSPEYWRCYFDQAFGAIQFAGFLAPENEAIIGELWDFYKKAFENLIKPLDNIPYL